MSQRVATGTKDFRPFQRAPACAVQQGRDKKGGRKLRDAVGVTPLVPPGRARIDPFKPRVIRVLAAGRPDPTSLTSGLLRGSGNGLPRYDFVGVTGIGASKLRGAPGLDGGASGAS
jgi:hypothetical protein